jgi:hypothetical protein
VLVIASTAWASFFSRKVTVEVVDLAGNSRQVDLNALPAVSEAGGFKKTTGTIVGPATFTGPRLSDVIGGAEFGPDCALEVTASDGYTMTLSYEQVQGNVMTYDRDGQALKIGVPNVLVALKSSDPKLNEGFPRIIFTGPDAPLTDGHFWVKDVARLRVVPAVSGWEIKLEGLEEAVMDRSTFESTATCPVTPHPGRKWETEAKDGSTEVYEGIGLWVLVSMVDGGDATEGHYRFNRELADAGYKVQVFAEDGHVAEFSSQEVAYNNDIFLAYLKNGKPLDEDEGPVKLVGPGLPSKKHSVKQVALIRLVELPE